LRASFAAPEGERGAIRCTIKYTAGMSAQSKAIAAAMFVVIVCAFALAGGVGLLNRRDPAAVSPPPVTPAVTEPDDRLS